VITGLKMDTEIIGKEKGIMEVILFMARMNEVPLKGEPCGIPFP